MIATSTKRIESIDLLRGIVMVIMTLDHVRDYFHRDAFFYEPTDLSRTNILLFFTRWITHYCAPVFVFLAGTSAYLYGLKRTKGELAHYLLTRGIWLVLAELFIISLGITFNPAYPLFKLQVIWAIGISMMVLAGMIWLDRRLILVFALLFIAAHNLLDNVHIPGAGSVSFFWSFLHEQKYFYFGGFKVYVQYPVLPWIGVMALGYCFGELYDPGYDAEKRRKILRSFGLAFIILFLAFRYFNLYGEGVHWTTQKNNLFALLSILNVSKYPPSLLYVLVTLGPALIFLSLTEKPLNALTSRLSVFGRVPFFYYVLHIYCIHLLAMIGAIILGYPESAMILTDRVNAVPALKGYGFSLITVYLVWAGVVIYLYPVCKWFDHYKRQHVMNQRWLTYL